MTKVNGSLQVRPVIFSLHNEQIKSLPDSLGQMMHYEITEL